MTDSKALAQSATAQAQARGLNLSTILKIGSAVVSAILALEEGQSVTETVTVKLGGQRWDVGITAKRHTP
jgi:hypothetical protein